MPPQRPGRGQSMARAVQTWGMEKSSDSGAKSFAILVGIMVAIVLTLIVIAFVLSPR